MPRKSQGRNLALAYLLLRAARERRGRQLSPLQAVGPDWSADLLHSARLHAILPRRRLR